MTDARDTSETSPEAPKRRYRFNYFACFFDAVGFPLGISFFSAATILPLFVRELTDQTIWIGLIAAISSSGFFLPQLFAANWIERLPIKHHYVLKLALLERIAILALVPLSLTFGRSSPQLLLVTFFVAFVVHNLCMGLNGPAYFDLVAKVIAPNKRGKMYGIAGGVGGLLSILGAWLSKVFLERFSFPMSFALCFLVGFIILTVTVIPFGFIDEPQSRIGERIRLLKYLRGAGVTLRRDVNFRRFVASQVLLSAFEVPVAFFTTFALDELGAKKAEVAIFTAVFMAGRMVGEPFWGALADRYGNRIVLVINIGLACLVVPFAAFTPTVGLFYGVFALTSFSQSGFNIPSFNITMEFAPPESLPTYTALRSTLTAPFRAAFPLIAGAVISHTGYKPVFFVATALLVVSWFMLLRVKEPRGKEKVSR